MTITIYHNPRCSKSRQTLQLLKDQKVDAEIVEYLKNPPSAETVLKLAESLNVSVADLLRRGESEFSSIDKSVALDDDAAVAKAISQHPILLQRPIVVNDTSGKAVIGRPPENVLEII